MARIIEFMKLFCDRVENILGKRENVDSPFPEIFSKGQLPHCGQNSQLKLR